jgi:hypothetical protein
MIVDYEMSNDDYHRHPGYSSSDVKDVASSTLAHWKNRVRKESHAFDLGSAVHSMLLEPELNLVVEGTETRRGKDWTSMKEAADFAGKILLPKKEYQLAEQMAQAALFTPHVAELITDKHATKEASYFVREPVYNLDLKCRPDGLLSHKNLVFDIKTCQDASPRGFAKAVRDYSYDVQASFYKFCLELYGHTVDRFLFICIEKQNPFIVQVHELSGEYLDHAKKRMMDTLKIIKEADMTGDYTTGWPEVNTIALPSWMVKTDFEIPA